MMATTTATPPPSATLSLLPPFASDFGPRPLPQAAKKPYADLGSSSIRTQGYEHRMSLPHPPLPAGGLSVGGPSGSGIKVVNSSNTRSEMSRTGFSVNGRRSSSFVTTTSSSNGSSSSASMGMGKAGPGPSSRSASYGQESVGAGPMKRKLFYAVADGHQKGIYETWAEAEEQIKGHPAPQWKTFKTRLAAESYILSASPFATTAPADAETGAYDMQLEYPASSSPTYEAPLHERLEREFPSTTPKSAPSPPLADLQPPRPHFARGSGSRSSSPTSPMKRSSPLRQEVTDNEAERERDRERERSAQDGEESDSISSMTDMGDLTIGKKQKKRSSFMARFSSGLLSPPTSPEAAAQGTKSFRVESIERPVLAPPIVLPPTDVSRPNSRASSRSTNNRVSLRPAVPRSPSTGDVEAAAAYEQRPGSIRSVSSSSVASRQNGGSVLGPKPPLTPTRGLWGDATPPLSPPLSPPNLKYGHHDRASSPSGSDADVDEFGAGPKSNAPKFSRSAMKKQGVLLPVSAKQASLNGSRPSSPALSRSPSFASLNRKASHTSLNSIGSFGSFGALRDKLSAVQIAEEEPRRGDVENVKPTTRARPNMSSRSVSKESVTSDASAMSFATANEDVPPAAPKKTPNGSQDGHQLGDPEKLSPIPSNASVSDDVHGSSRSDATHTQSEACGGKYGEDRRLGKKKSFKRLLRALGFSKMDETKEKTDWERRSSA